MNRKALMPAKPPNHGSKIKPKMSRQAAAWLLVAAGLLVAYHYARQQNLDAGGIPVIAPALHVALRGEVTTFSGDRLTVRVEDTSGNLTGITRIVQLSAQTRYQTPGEPQLTGSSGMSYIKPGYRVLIHGLEVGDGRTVNASQVTVSFPPVTGTLTALNGADLVIKLPGQTPTMTVTATSRTAFFVAGGRWSSVVKGVPIRVWIAPEVSHPGRFDALTVMVESRS